MKPDPSMLAMAASVIATTVEELSFLPVDLVADDQQQALDPAFYWGMVTASGVDVAWMGLAMPLDLVTEIGDTVLGPPSEGGEPDALSPSRQEKLFDLVGELANTAGGCLIRALSPGLKFSLGLPLTGCGTPPWSTECTHTQFMVGDKPLHAFLGWRSE